jgi:hypothetical protein
MEEWDELDMIPEELETQRTYRRKRGAHMCYLHLHRLPDGSWDAILYDEGTRMLDHDHVDTPVEARVWAQRRLEAMFAE